MLVDTHAHLYWESFQEDLKEVVDRAVENKVTTIINVGVDVETSRKALAQIQDPNSPLYNVVNYSSVGLHPHEGSQFVHDTNESIEKQLITLEEIASSAPERVIAVGECGLDYFFHGNSDFIPTDITIDELKVIQMKLFKAQAEMSKKLNLPLIVHCRDAWNDIFTPLEGTRGLFHTFTGNKNDVKKALDLGYYLSISCIITYPKNEELREIVKDAPLDKLLTETDCPFLPPQTIRGQRNEPANVVEIVKIIADLKGLSVEEIASQIKLNFSTLFKV